MTKMATPRKLGSRRITRVLMRVILVISLSFCGFHSFGLSWESFFRGYDPRCVNGTALHPLVWEILKIPQFRAAVVASQQGKCYDIQLSMKTILLLVAPGLDYPPRSHLSSRYVLKVNSGEWLKIFHHGQAIVRGWRVGVSSSSGLL